MVLDIDEPQTGRNPAARAKHEKDSFVLAHTVAALSVELAL